MHLNFETLQIKQTFLVKLNVSLRCQSKMDPCILNFITVIHSISRTLLTLIALVTVMFFPQCLSVIKWVKHNEIQKQTC